MNHFNGIKRSLTKITLLMILQLLVFRCNAQSNNYYGAGFHVGRSSSCGEGALSVLYNIHRKYEFKLGIGQAKYREFSYGFDLLLSPLFIKSKFQPIIGCNYTKFLARTFSYGTDDNHISKYHFQTQEYFVPMLGLKRDYISTQYSRSMLSVRGFITYRLVSNSNTKAEKISGNAPQSLDNQINNRITEKWGFNLQLIIAFQANKN